jgi:23S rRNA pseudouridine955/2504/2580 synthase
LSVAEILSGAFAASPYIPAPAHRLDRRSSGLLLAGLSRAAAARLQIQFKNGGICKYYLAWSAGFVPWEGPLLLEDRLAKRVFGGREVVSAGIEGQRALCAALVLRRQEPASLPVPASLLLLRLLSGRKHQLRVQLAARGFPLIGDGLRGGPDFPVLLLHAHSLGIPARGARADPFEERFAVSGDTSAQEARYEFCLPAPWPLDLVPDEREIYGAKKILDAHVAAMCPMASYA